MSNTINNYHKEEITKELSKMTGTFNWQLFNKEITISTDIEVSLEYLERCINHLNNLPETIILELCKGSINYCEDYRKDFEEMAVNIPKNLKDKEILNYVTPTTLVVDKSNEAEISYSLVFECAWEEEHGMSWIIKEDKVLYVGPYEGFNTWEDEDYWKYVSGNYLGNNKCLDLIIKLFKKLLNTYFKDTDLSSFEDNGNIYYMNDIDGTIFDWNNNQRLCEFMMFYEKSRMGAIKVNLYSDGIARAYLYKDGANKAYKTHEEKIMTPTSTHELAALMNKIADEEGLYGKSIYTMKVWKSILKSDIEKLDLTNE